SSVTVFGDPSTRGGVTNTGTIAAGADGVIADGDATFFGGITNSGTITSRTQHGIIVTDVAVFAAGGAGGGSTNSGVIAASVAAIEVSSSSSRFSGGISNSGRLTAGQGIFLENVAVFGNTGAGGGISNSGTIAAKHSGIGLTDVSSFFGGISNAGKIF